MRQPLRTKNSPKPRPLKLPVFWTAVWHLNAKRLLIRPCWPELPGPTWESREWKIPSGAVEEGIFSGKSQTSSDGSLGNWADWATHATPALFYEWIFTDLPWNVSKASQADSHWNSVSGAYLLEVPDRKKQKAKFTIPREFWSMHILFPIFHYKVYLLLGFFTVIRYVHRSGLHMKPVWKDEVSHSILG